MAVLQDININVHGQPSEKRLQTFLRLSQNENGRMINFRVLGPPLPSGCTATFSGTKPDGNVYSKTGTVTGNFVVIQEDMQMTAVAGVWDAKLDIINGAHNIMTALIRVVIDADVVDPDAIASDSQLQGLVAEAKYYAEHARTDAYGSPLTAPTKAQMTDHTRVYVYTGSEPNMVAGNWYHWNGTAWISGGVYNAVAVQTDTTLSVAGKAADGKAAGDAINELKEDLNAIQTATSADVDKALKVKTVTNGKVTEWEFGSTGADLSGLMVELDKSDKSAVYSKGNVGSSISFSSSNTSVTFKKILVVEKGKTYTLKIENGETPASTSTRDSRITDSEGVVKQLIPIETEAGATFTAVFTALADGWLYLTLDNQYVSLSIDGGQLYDDHNELHTVADEVDVINDAVGIEKAEYYGLYTQSSSDGYLINTPVPDTTYDARILMRLLNVRAGDEMTLSLSDYWTDTAYDFCIQTCKADNKGITIYGTRTYVNTSDVTVSEKLNRNFISAKKAVPVVVNFTNDYPVVYVVIRWVKARTLNGNYGKVANVIVRKSATVRHAVTLLDVRKRVGDISSIHRGWADAKDNSLQAFYNAFAKGYRFCECDIKWTSDNVPVLSHDSTVSGYVNGTATSYTIENVTLETLKGLVITNGKYDNMAVPTVEEAIQLGKFMGGRYVLDAIKTMSLARYDIILGLLEQYDYWDGILFNTNSSLGQYVMEESDSRACLYCGTTTLAELEELELIKDPKKIFIIFDMANLPTQAEINAVSAKGYNIGAWNVSGDNFFSALDYGFDLMEYMDGSKSYYDWQTMGEQWYNARLATFAENHNITI